VLARHVEHRQAGLLEDLVGVVELLVLGELGDVAGVQDEVGLRRHGFDLRHRLAEGRPRVGLGSLAKPMWLSLTCRKVKGVTADFGAAMAWSRLTELRTPPPTLQTRPVPAQPIHSRIRRLFGCSVIGLAACSVASPD
jgi:hypothetical protein